MRQVTGANRMLNLVVVSGCGAGGIARLYGGDGYLAWSPNSVVATGPF